MSIRCAKFLLTLFFRMYIWFKTSIKITSIWSVAVLLAIYLTSFIQTEWFHYSNERLWYKISVETCVWSTLNLIPSSNQVKTNKPHFFLSPKVHTMCRFVDCFTFLLLIFVFFAAYFAHVHIIAIFFHFKAVFMIKFMGMLLYRSHVSIYKHSRERNRHIYDAYR